MVVKLKKSFHMCHLKDGMEWAIEWHPCKMLQILL